MGRVGRLFSASYIKGDVEGFKQCGMPSRTAKIVNGVVVVSNWFLLPFSLMFLIWNIKSCNSISKDNKILRQLILSMANDENASVIVELLQALELLKGYDAEIRSAYWIDDEIAKKFLSIAGMEEKLSQSKRLKYVYNRLIKKKIVVPELQGQEKLQVKKMCAHSIVTYV